MTYLHQRSVDRESIIGVEALSKLTDLDDQLFGPLPSATIGTFGLPADPAKVEKDEDEDDKHETNACVDTDAQITELQEYLLIMLDLDPEDSTPDPAVAGDLQRGEQLYLYEEDFTVSDTSRPFVVDVPTTNNQVAAHPLSASTPFHGHTRPFVFGGPSTAFQFSAPTDSGVPYSSEKEGRSPTQPKDEDESQTDTSLLVEPTVTGNHATTQDPIPASTVDENDLIDFDTGPSLSPGSSETTLESSEDNGTDVGASGPDGSSVLVDSTAENQVSVPVESGASSSEKGKSVCAEKAFPTEKENKKDDSSTTTKSGNWRRFLHNPTRDVRICCPWPTSTSLESPHTACNKGVPIDAFENHLKEHLGKADKASKFICRLPLVKGHCSGAFHSARALMRHILGMPKTHNAPQGRSWKDGRWGELVALEKMRCLYPKCKWVSQIHVGGNESSLQVHIRDRHLGRAKMKAGPSADDGNEEEQGAGVAFEVAARTDDSVVLHSAHIHDHNGGNAASARAAIQPAQAVDAGMTSHIFQLRSSTSEISANGAYIPTFIDSSSPTLDNSLINTTSQTVGFTSSAATSDFNDYFRGYIPPSQCYSSLHPNLGNGRATTASHRFDFDSSTSRSSDDHEDGRYSHASSSSQGYSSDSHTSFIPPSFDNDSVASCTTDGLVTTGTYGSNVTTLCRLTPAAGYTDHQANYATGNFVAPNTGSGLGLIGDIYSTNNVAAANYFPMNGYENTTVVPRVFGNADDSYHTSDDMSFASLGALQLPQSIVYGHNSTPEYDGSDFNYTPPGHATSNYSNAR